MDAIRLAPTGSVFPQLPCCRCGDNSRYWDRLGGKTYCPNCTEALAVGDGESIAERTDRRRCAVCHHLGTLRYLTFPLNSRRPVEMDLCGEHLRALLSRRLGPHAYGQLRRQLTGLELAVSRIFLLHEAFYDDHGHALQPAVEWY
ncbi:MAG: hypothetical protein L0Y72_09335 [Gemmataceae bacterium]|nr:hypothetical protein [Gemmataceae bacterium]MCI0739235.1 hypothetical protein [Gemmataceae bacterium]